MDTVSLSGTVPVQMLLEVGLDKLKKDYISFFIGKSLSQLKKLRSISQLSARRYSQILSFYLSLVVLALSLFSGPLISLSVNRLKITIVFICFSLKFLRFYD